MLILLPNIMDTVRLEQNGISMSSPPQKSVLQQSRMIMKKHCRQEACKEQNPII